MIRKSGPVSEAEKSAALAIKSLNPATTDAAIAKVLNRSKAAIAQHLTDARIMLLENATTVASNMLRASSIAADRGDSRPSEWILGRISSVGEDGKVVRVVEAEREQATAAGLTVNIGLAIGNIPQGETRLSTTPLLPLEGQCIAVSDSIIKS
jgi:hypothetical protein